MTFKNFSNTDLILLIANMEHIDGSSKGDYIKSIAYKDLLARINFDETKEVVPKREFININTTRDV